MRRNPWFHENQNLDLWISECTFGNLKLQEEWNTHLCADTFLELLDTFEKNNTIRQDTKIYLSHINQCHTAPHEKLQKIMTDGSAGAGFRKNLSISMYFRRNWNSQEDMRSAIWKSRQSILSLKWQMVVEDVYCTSVSAVRMEDVKPVESDDEMIRKLDRVSLRTLHNCMQSVFEDGPKRRPPSVARRLKTSGTCKLWNIPQYGSGKKMPVPVCRPDQR